MLYLFINMYCKGLAAGLTQLHFFCVVITQKNTTLPHLPFNTKRRGQELHRVTCLGQDDFVLPLRHRGQLSGHPIPLTTTFHIYYYKSEAIKQRLVISHQ